MRITFFPTLSFIVICFSISTLFNHMNTYVSLFNNVKKQTIYSFPYNKFPQLTLFTLKKNNNSKKEHIDILRKIHHEHYQFNQPKLDLSSLSEIEKNNHTSSSLSTLPIPDKKNDEVNSWKIMWVFIIHVNGNELRFKAISNTWAHIFSDDIGIIFFGKNKTFLESIEAKLHTRKFKDQYHFFHVDEHSNNNFDSTLKAFSYGFTSYPSAKYFAKFDDDTYVYSRELIRQVLVIDEQLNNKNNPKGKFYYGGYPIQGTDNLIFASGGAGYILSKDATKLLIQCSPSDPRYEDMAVGQCMSNSQISMENLIGLHPHHPYQMLSWDIHGHPSDRIIKHEPMESYMNPLSYHYIPPHDMIQMHKDIYLHGYHQVENVYQQKFKRNGVPHIMHQFWETNNKEVKDQQDLDKSRPQRYMQKCKEVHPQWKHIIWNQKEINKQFPSGENPTGFLHFNGKFGHLVNQDLYDKARELNLKSDISRYEFLMLFGGVYVDADSECFRHMDFLIHESMEKNKVQAIGFLEKDENYLQGLLASGVICVSHAYSPLMITLVSELRHTDWNLLPWQSAGPLFFTKIVTLFKSKISQGLIPNWLDIQVLPSYHVYPHHFNDKRPTIAALPQALILKGAVMDQKWGTTQNLYKDSQWSSKNKKESISDNLFYEQRLSNSEWINILKRYVKSVHNVGLSTLATYRPRWVIANVHPSAGLCNRIMNILASMAFAMATGRVLLFDWNKMDPFLHVDGKEWMSSSNLEDIFAPLPFAYNLQDAKEKFGTFYEQNKANNYVVEHGDLTFLHDLLNIDLDVKYPQSIIIMNRYDWWAAPLFENPFYKNTVWPIGTTSSQEIFSELFKFLFAPKIQYTPEKCDWLIQHRSNWDRSTAHLKSFEKCAESHGMKPSDNQMIISDSQTYASQSKLPIGCRKGLQCDQEAIQTIYSMSQCSHAILTHTSTFGACITGLWGISDVFLVKADESCIKKQYMDPIEAGVLDHEPKQITTVLSTIGLSLTNPKFAFVYLMVYPSDTAVADLQRSIASLHEHFNHKHHYPIILFVDNYEKWVHLQFIFSVRIHIIEINPKDWEVQPSNLEYPTTFFISKSAPEHKGFSMQYRQMSRFASGYLLTHPALARFDYVIKLDSDTFAYAQWQTDPFMQMYQTNSTIGYWVGYSDIDDVTMNLWNTFASFMKSQKIQMKQPELVLDSLGKYRNTNFYGCFLGFKTSEFNSNQYKQFFNYFDATGGFFMHRWDEQKIFAFYAALYLESNQVEFFQGISIEHQIWAKQPMKWIPMSISDTILQQIYT